MDFSQRSAKDWISQAESSGGEAAELAVPEQPQGDELLRQVATLSGLPGEWVTQELEGVFENMGCDSSQLTLEQLRAAMLAYLESIQADMMPDDLEPQA